MMKLGRLLLISSRAARRCGLNSTCFVGFGCCERRIRGFTKLGCCDLFSVDRLSDARGFRSGFATFGAGQGSDGTSDHSSELSEKDYHSFANETLHHLQEKIDELGEQITLDGFDSDYAEGVLTVRLGDLGTYVINKQTPNRQIWLSSPVSGPARFDWQDSKWVYKRTRAELQNLLQKEFTDLLGRSVDFSSR